MGEEFEMSSLGRLRHGDRLSYQGSAAKRDSSKHYYQGGYDYEFVDEVSSRFECPICLLCQRDPHQTSCGHRFCYTCILTWLCDGKTCPHDNCTISEGDLYPDAIAHREILQLRVKCPNAKTYGCREVLKVSDMVLHERHCQESRQELPQTQPSVAPNEKESMTCPSCGELLDETFSELNSRKHNLICPNTPVACPLAAAGCTDPISRSELADHVQHSAVRHVQLLWERLLKLQQILNAQDVTDIDPGEMSTRCRSSSCSRESPQAGDGLPTISGRDDTLRMSGSNLHSTQRLIKDLFQRVVTLEQKNREGELVNQNLRGQIRELRLLHGSREDEKWETIGRNCNGRFTWKIARFSEFHEKMRHNHSFVIYSRGFYTSPFGYKFCLRCNIHIIGGEEHLGLFVHLMTGENDDILNWPFAGKIVLTLKNRDESRLFKEDFCETMSTPGESTSAFQRPPSQVPGRNPVGYGLQEFIRVNALYSGGFVTPQSVVKSSRSDEASDDILIVKTHVISTSED